MFSSILWKEYREHRFVWAALAVVGAALLLVMPAVLAPTGMGDRPNVLLTLHVAAVVLAWVYGVVCGAMLLAGERESSTLPFLDALPGWRWRLWGGKALAGALLALTQAALLAVAAWGAGLMPTLGDAAWLLVWMAVAGVYGLGWGLFFSAFGRNVMNVILASLPFQLAALIVAYVAGYVVGTTTAFVAGVNVSNLDEQRNAFMAAGMIGVSFLIGLAALAESAVIFTAPDRARLRTVPSAKAGGPRRIRSAPLWLAWRQARGFAAGLAVFALLLALMMFAWSLLVWPLATLVIGVLCGVTAFADEQEGPYRFLGDQRFPLGRLWLVKVGLRFGIAVGAALIVLAPRFFVALANSPFITDRHSEGPYFFFAHVFSSNLIGELCPSGVFVTVWLVTGFAAGCLCGLLFRNGLAAGVVALFTGALLTAVWVPSMLGGGLHLWQALGPPVLLLLSTPWLMRPWAAGRIASWTTARRLTPFVALAVLWIAGGLWYRVVEVPYVPENPALDAFVASLPTPDHNEGGELARQACLRFDDLKRALRSEEPPPAPHGPGEVFHTDTALSNRAVDVLDHGWNRDDAELAAWLDKLFAGEWVGMLKKSADLPTGEIDDLRHITQWSLLPAAQPAREIGLVLAVSGLQRQAAGDDESYVENLRIGLHLSETMRHHASTIDVLVGRAVEATLVRGLDRWLERLNGRPDLLQRALGLLSRHLEATADDADDQKLVEDLIVRNTAEDTFRFSLSFLRETTGEQHEPHVQEEAQWVALAWLTPWEQERQARILRVMFWGDAAQQRVLHTSEQFGPLPQLGPYQMDILHRTTQGSLLCASRAMLLKLALRWYQADHGRPADNLDELIPKYLKSIPTDPFSPDGRPFHYRLSKGEEIEWPGEPPPPGAPAGGGAPAAPQAAPPPGMPAAPGMMAPGVAAPAPPPHTRKIPPGQGVLWSVGEDGHDDGGHRQLDPSNGSAPAGEDMIFLVPLPPSDK